MIGGLAFVTAQQPKLDQQHDTRRAAAVAILTLLKGSRGFILALPSRYTASALQILEEIAHALYHLLLIDKNVCFLRFFHISTLADFCLTCTLYNLGKFFLLFFPLLSTTSAIGEARTTLPVCTYMPGHMVCENRTWISFCIFAPCPEPDGDSSSNISSSALQLTTFIFGIALP